MTLRYFVPKGGEKREQISKINANLDEINEVVCH